MHRVPLAQSAALSPSDEPPPPAGPPAAWPVVAPWPHAHPPTFRTPCTDTQKARTPAALTTTARAPDGRSGIWDNRAQRPGTVQIVACGQHNSAAAKLNYVVHTRHGKKLPRASPPGEVIRALSASGQACAALFCTMLAARPHSPPDQSPRRPRRGFAGRPPLLGHPSCARSPQEKHKRP